MKNIKALFLARIAELSDSDLTVVSFEENETYEEKITAWIPKNEGLVPSYKLEYEEMDDVPDGSIAYHPVFGDISYRSRWRFSTERFTKLLKMADENEKIAAHIIHINSCGGEAFGLHEAFLAIKALKKPCYAVIDSVAASAGYYLACGADKVYASSLFSQIGCIGTMCTVMDDSKFWESHGITIRDYYSSYSELKNKIFTDAINGEGDEFINRYLDPLAKAFIDDVSSVRTSLSEDAMKGETYYAPEAMSAGLVDGQMNFDEVLEALSKKIQKNDTPEIDINKLNF